MSQRYKKNKRLDFNLLQNRNPTVVYGIVYVVALVETQDLAFLQLVFQPKTKKSVVNAVGSFFRCN